MDLHDLRREYLLGELRSADLGDDPHDQFAKWMKQVRVSGVAERLSVEDSQRYFHSRPRGSQLAAAVSPQSEVVESREALEAAFAALDKSTEGAEVPCPSTWGGYRVRASQIEFWQGGANRLHNRFRYTRDGLTWIIERLAP